MLPKIPYKMSKNKRQTTSFRGINYSNVTSEGDIADSKNISARAYPYLTTRKSRNDCSYLLISDDEGGNAALYEKVTAVTSFMGKLAAVADGKFYYDGRFVGELTPGEKQFAAVNTKLCIMPDKKYFDLQTMRLENMDALVYATAQFLPVDAADDITDGISLASEKKLIARGPGVTVSEDNKTVSITISESIYAGSIGLLRRATYESDDSDTLKKVAQSELYFCNCLGTCDLTLGLTGDGTDWRLFANWSAEPTDDASFIEGDILFLSDGAIYEVTEISGDDVVARRWHPARGCFCRYGSDAYGNDLFSHLGVKVYKPARVDDVVNDVLTTSGCVHVKTDSIDGLLDIYKVEDSCVRLTTRVGDGVFEGTVITEGWDIETDFTKILENGDTITLDVSGCSSVSATASQVDKSSITFQEDGILASIDNAEENAMTTILKTTGYDAAEIASIFKKGDCVTITGADIPENNLSFIVSDIDGATLYASSAIFVADADNFYNLTIERKIPDMDFICESGNRLWGCSNKDNTIYVSALGDPTNFFVNSAISTDSFAVAVGSEGKFTACCRYGSDVLFWKETKLHKVIGSYPAEYTLYSYDIEGVQARCEKSLAVINEVLYYKGIHGVYAFASAPTLISSNFGERYFTDAVAGADGDSYYLSVKGEDGRNYLFVYETTLGTWILEDDVRVDDFIRDGKDLYMRTEDGKFYLCGASDTGTEMEWFVQLTPFYETLEGSKTYSRLLLRVELPRGSYLRVVVRTDGGAWREAGKVIGRSYDVVPIRIPINRCDKFEIKLSGKGKCTVLSMMREFYVGGDR